MLYRLEAPLVQVFKAVAEIALCVQMSARIFGKLGNIVEVVGIIPVLDYLKFIRISLIYKLDVRVTDTANAKWNIISCAQLHHKLKARANIAAADGEGKIGFTFSVQQCDKSVAAVGDRLHKSFVPHIDIAETIICAA